LNPDPDPAFEVNSDTNPDMDPIRIQGFDEEKMEENFFFFYQNLPFTYPKASIKDMKATGEAFSPQKRTSQRFKKLNALTFSIFVSHFCPPRSVLRIRIRIRTQGPH
jgi:hypothetical protein